MKIFMRIDDVGGWRDDSEYLRPLLDYLISQQLSFNLQIVPQWLSNKSVDYLLGVIKDVPHLIEIDQHGYSHNLSEFTSVTSRERQQLFVEEGMKQIRDALGVVPYAFTPPEHLYTEATIEVLNNAGFKAFSKQVKPTIDGKIFYKLGHLRRRLFLLGKKVSYHGHIIPDTHMYEWSISVESSLNNRIKNLPLIQQEFAQANKYLDVIGFLIHHSCLNTKDNMERLFQAIDFIAGFGQGKTININQLVADF